MLHNESFHPIYGPETHRGNLLSDGRGRRTRARVVEIAQSGRGPKQIGVDIKTVEFGWPMGMPVCKPLGDGLYEVRSNLSQNRIARVLFYIDAKSRMVLLHGFIKRTQKTPQADLELARKNKALHESEMKRMR